MASVSGNRDGDRPDIFVFEKTLPGLEILFDRDTDVRKGFLLGGCGNAGLSACEFRHVPEAGFADGVVHCVWGEVGTIWPAHASLDSCRLSKCGRVA